MAQHKRLQGGVILVGEAPKLASGKIRLKTMREQAQKDALELQARYAVKTIASG